MFRLMASSYGSRGEAGILLSIVTRSIAKRGGKSQAERVRKADRNMVTRELLLALGLKTTGVNYLSAPPMIVTKI